MNEKPSIPRRKFTYAAIAAALFLFGAMSLGFWISWNFYERIRIQTETQQGLEGEWRDDSGQDVSYRFRKDGEFLIRQKLPSNLAPFSGDSGVEYRTWGKWSRSKQAISVKTPRNWGFELTLGEDGVLRGERVTDQWSGQGEHSRSKSKVVLTREGQ